MILVLMDERRILAELTRELATAQEEPLQAVLTMTMETMKAPILVSNSARLERIAAALIKVIPANKPVQTGSLYSRLSVLITALQLTARKDQWSRTVDRVTGVVKHFPCTDDVYTGHCPVCGAPLLRFGHRERGVINASGEKEIFDLRRLRCKHCGHTHIELLDIMVPYHRHNASVVEAALDGTANHLTGSQISEWNIARLRRRFADMGGALIKEATGRVGKRLAAIKASCGGGLGWVTVLAFRLVTAGLWSIPKKMKVWAGKPPQKK